LSTAGTGTAEDAKSAENRKHHPATCVYDNIRSVFMVFAAVKAMKSGKLVRVMDPDIRRLLRKMK